MPEIVPKVVPDPPLHSAQIILASRKKDFYVFNRNVFGGLQLEATCCCSAQAESEGGAKTLVLTVSCTVCLL